MPNSATYLRESEPEMRKRGLSDPLRDRLLAWLYEYPPLRDKVGRDDWLWALPEEARDSLITSRPDHYKFDLRSIVESVKAQRLRDGQWLILILVDKLLSDVKILDIGADLEVLKQEIERELQPRRPFPTWEDFVQEDHDFAQAIQREELMQEILQYLRGTPVSESNPIVLYGQSMVGKTRILRHLCDELGNTHTPLLVTLQDIRLSNLGLFLHDLADGLTNGINNVFFPDLAAPDGEEFGGGKGEATFRMHWNRLREIAGGRQPVVMFDEVDHLLDQAREELSGVSNRELDDILAFFRRFVHSPSNGYFVLAGSEYLLPLGSEHLDLLTDGRQPNCVPHCVPYDDRIAEQCLKAVQKDYVKFENHALKCITALCDGHPRIIQDTYEVIASVVNQLPNKHTIERDDIESIIGRKVIEKATDALQALWLRLSSSEREIVNLASKKKFLPWIQGSMDFFECSLKDLVALADANSTVDYNCLREGAYGLAERNLIEWKNKDKDLFCFRLCALPLWCGWGLAQPNIGDGFQ